MQVFIGLIIIVFGILQIILFFKIWGMTNDIREIKEKYLSSTDPKKSISPTQLPEFNIGELVTEIKANKQMRIKEITKDGKYSCYTNGGVSHEGDFDASEIKRFN
ncbi:hypothetical protein [Bacteroides sp.]|uniref:hypothetical protein n=1 Tax=Bacteroides sp. TaxID=29523 RepID=UPI0026121B37|nr:hypothetical protein [Bacteroides sp.]MDD3040151.1 hypothetical protein [Bacteroides sp.]